MIAKITRGALVGGLAAFLHGPGRANEHVYGGRLGGAVIGGTLGADGARDGRGWAADMQSAIDGRPEVVGPVWHMSVRCAPGDRALSDAEWRHAAQMMGERWGGPEPPWVWAPQGEPHGPVAFTGVGGQGTIWHARNDRRAAQEARQVVERDFGLKQAPVRRESSRSLTSGEQARASRTGVEPPRHDLARRVRAAADAAKGLGRETFEEVLAAQGVTFRANVASTGRVSGYSFALAEHVDAAGERVWWKGSQLDKGLSWKALDARLSAPLPEPPVQVPAKKMLERASTYQERVESVRREARAQDLASRRQGAYRVAITAREERAKGSALRWRTRQATSERTQLGKRRAVFWERPRVGGTPIGNVSVEDIENLRQIREIQAATYPGGVHAAIRRSLARGAASLGESTYTARNRQQNNDRGRGRGGLGR